MVGIPIDSSSSETRRWRMRLAIAVAIAANSIILLRGLSRHVGSFDCSVEQQQQPFFLVRFVDVVCSPKPTIANSVLVP